MFEIVGIRKDDDLTYCMTEPRHPKGRGVKKFVPLHLVRAENALGRRLKRGEEVVHIDGNRFNNVVSNLAIKSPETKPVSVEDLARACTEAV